MARGKGRGGREVEWLPWQRRGGGNHGNHEAWSPLGCPGNGLLEMLREAWVGLEEVGL